MEDRIISYNTAVLAKAKGFDWETNYGYCKESPEHPFNARDNCETDYNWNNRVGFSAPSQTVLMDWLREIHNIYIEILIDQTTDPKFCYEIYKYKDFGDWTTITNKETWGLTMDYHKNIEDALKEALSYIE